MDGPPTFVFPCAACSRPLSVPRAAAGRAGTCPTCGERQIVPQPPAAPDVAPPVPQPPAESAQDAALRRAFGRFLPGEDRPEPPAPAGRPSRGYAGTCRQCGKRINNPSSFCPKCRPW